MNTVGERQKIIIDGYNVIYADDALRRIAIKDMERARREFVDRIKSYLGDKKLQVTVVFDGRGGGVDAEVILPGALQLVYSAAHETADDLIISTVTASDNPTAYLVVTSDKAHIRPAVTSLGCKVIGSRRFLERISDRPNDRQATDREEEKPTPDSVDTDYWLKQFQKGTGGKRDS